MHDLDFAEYMNLSREKHTLLVDTTLRALRTSFGLFNTVLVLILLKPFHEPILKTLVRVREKMQNIRVWTMKITSSAKAPQTVNIAAELND